MRPLVEVGLLAPAVAAVTMTVTKAKVFKPLRRAMSKRSTWLGELFQCTYCMSHWISLVLWLLFRPVVVPGSVLQDGLLTVFSLVCLSSFFMWLIYRSHSAIPLGDDEE